LFFILTFPKFYIIFRFIYSYTDEEVEFIEIFDDETIDALNIDANNIDKSSFSENHIVDDDDIIEDIAVDKIVDINVENLFDNHYIDDNDDGFVEEYVGHEVEVLI
jgi:hypothetical protein